MDVTANSIWVTASQSVIAMFLLITAALAAASGHGVRRIVRRRLRHLGREESIAGQETYLVSQVLGLLSLLLAFTFGVALDRYETRRTLVSSEANAVGDLYFIARMVGGDEGAHIARLLRSYVDHRVELGSRSDRQQELLLRNDRLLIELSTTVIATRAKAETLGLQVPLTNNTSLILDFDRLRKVARQTRVPLEVLQVLYVYLIVAAAVLGFTIDGARTRLVAIILFLLLTMSIIVIVDLNRPTSGAIREPQMAMEMLQKALADQPPIRVSR